MGLDEALLERGPDRPTLRFYTWLPDALSLGYFQRFADVPAAARASEVVRRVTGGGAIHHVEELTFSIAARAGEGVYRGAVADSYARVHGALASALKELGIDARLRGESVLRSDREGTGMCFHRSSALDLVWEGAKGVGSAQRRKGGRVLHHGSIKLAPSDLEEGVAVVGAPAAEVAERFCAALGSAFGIAFEDGEASEDELLEGYRRGARYGERDFVHRR